MNPYISLPITSFSDLQQEHDNVHNNCHIIGCKRITPDCKQYCQSCYTHYRQICNAYHNVPPCKELLLRLLFEIIFYSNRINLSNIKNGTWLCPTCRDYGHHVRMARLYRHCKIAHRKPWLAAKSYN